MESINKLVYQVKNCMIGAVLGFVVAIGSNIFSACYGDVQRGGGVLCTPQACTWERSDNRCNDSSECCPGKKCSSFGYCELCC